MASGPLHAQIFRPIFKVPPLQLSSFRPIFSLYQWPQCPQTHPPGTPTPLPHIRPGAQPEALSRCLLHPLHPVQQRHPTFLNSPLVPSPTRRLPPGPRVSSLIAPPPQRPPSNLFLLLTGSQTVDLWFDIESGEVDFLLGTSVGPRCQAAWQAKGQAPAGMSTLPATPYSQNLHATPSALPLGDSAWPSPPPPEALVS